MTNEIIELMAENEKLKADIERLKALQQDIVYCKDCKFYKDARENCKGFLICYISGMEITDNDFCSYGERRESEETDNE